MAWTWAGGCQFDGEGRLTGVLSEYSRTYNLPLCKTVRATR